VLLLGHEVLTVTEPPGVNFINVKCTNFLYECHFGSFFSSYMYVVKAAKMTFVRVICTFNVDEIDTRLTCVRL